MLAQRKCHCYKWIWEKKMFRPKNMEIHWRTNNVGVFGNTEKLAKFGWG
jgi:hypothetical protein